MLQLIAMAHQPLNSISFMVDNAQRAMSASEDYCDTLAELPEINDVNAEIAAFPAPISGAPAVEFDHVGFAYDAEAPVLHQVSFVAEPRQKVTFVGESGVGGRKIDDRELVAAAVRPDR